METLRKLLLFTIFIAVACVIWGSWTDARIIAASTLYLVLAGALFIWTAPEW